MIKRTAIFASILMSIFFTLSAAAQAEVKIPGRTKFLVNDYAGVLSPETNAYLEKLLSDLRGKYFTGTEIDVSTFKTLYGMPIDSFMYEYLRKWRRPFPLENDNRIHVILMISENKMRIGIGRYLKNIITKTDAKNIMDTVMVPEFRSGNYDSGIKKGVQIIVDILNKNKTPKSIFFTYVRRLFVPAIVIMVILAIILIQLRYKKY